MKPVRVKLLKLGGSAAIAIPRTLAEMYEWAPGARVMAKLIIGGALFEKETRELYGGKASGIIVPKPILESHRVKVGETLHVPFYEWVTIAAVPWPDDDDDEEAGA